jgi:hypothetical protein
MQDAHSVITFAAKGHVENMAAEMEVRPGRMYEMLGDQCVYPKAKRLIRVIGKFNRAGVRLIQADLEAMFRDILGGDDEPADVTVAEIHKEAFDVVDSLLSGKPAAEQKQELRELIACAALKIEAIERLEKRNPGGLHIA